MEHLWYEASPYVYALGALLALGSAPAALGVGSGALLLTSAALILRLRWTHRRAFAAERGKSRRASTATRKRSVRA